MSIVVGREKDSHEIVDSTASSGTLLIDIRNLIESARQQIATTVNTGMTLLYWEIGNRIRNDILKAERAEYGKQIVQELSASLSNEFGSGFAEKNLRRMIQFSEAFPDRKIVVSLTRQLSWTHFVALIPLSDTTKRDFYAEMCRIEHWSTRTLRRKIDGVLFERTVLSRKPEEIVKQEINALRDRDRVTPDLVFKDPYFLNFLGLNDTYSEKDLESAILQELEYFILELGSGFAFLARQKRMTIDHRDHYLDLLFYHRKLHRLVAIDLKLGEFKPEFKGQMELYLRWLERYELEAGEKAPLGLILCAGKSEEHIELLQLRESGIRVAEYLTELPSQELLEQKLHTAIATARQQLTTRTVLVNEEEHE